MSYGNPQGYGPQNGYPPPKKGIGAGTITLIIFGCLFSGCVGLCAVGAIAGKKEAAEQQAGTRGASQPASKAAAPEPTPKSYTKVSAGTLISDYEGNEIRGDSAWKGKDVEVTGVVKSIDKGPFGGLYVVLGDSSQRISFHSVHVNLKDSEMSRAAALNKGQTATFRGTVQGYVIGSVSLRDAELE